jgi:putative nucleotidyltransferase with HDIG domain
MERASFFQIDRHAVGNGVDVCYAYALATAFAATRSSDVRCGAWNGLGRRTQEEGSMFAPIPQPAFVPRALRAAARPAPAEPVRLSEVIAALSFALDITEGQPEGHAVRTCLIGMRLAEEIGLSDAERSALFYALLLKDLGCSSNAAKVCALLGGDDLLAKRDMKLTDWTSLPQAVRFGLEHLRPGGSPAARAAQLLRVGLEGGPFAARQIFAVRCDRGAQIAAMIGFPEATAAAIRALDEHWDGHGQPLGLRGAAIPLLARIACLAQTVDIFATAFDVEAAYAMARARRRRWFDPALVAALERFRHDRAFWDRLAGARGPGAVAGLEPPDQVLLADEAQIDRIAEAFAEVVDAKSPWTYRHSAGVAALADGLAQVMGFDAAARRDLRRAALLHDIGKLGISNRILDKHGPLDAEEQAAMRRHPVYTRRILERVGCFEPLAGVAAAHHERLDGSGYPDGLRADELSPAARVLAVADVCDALLADRPYRRGLPAHEVLRILRGEAGARLCPQAVEALAEVLR